MKYNNNNYINAHECTSQHAAIVKGALFTSFSLALLSARHYHCKMFCICYLLPLVFDTRVHLSLNGIFHFTCF